MWTLWEESCCSDCFSWGFYEQSLSGMHSLCPISCVTLSVRSPISENHFLILPSFMKKMHKIRQREYSPACYQFLCLASPYKALSRIWAVGFVPQIRWFITADTICEKGCTKIKVYQMFPPNLFQGKGMWNSATVVSRLFQEFVDFKYQYAGNGK